MGVQNFDVEFEDYIIFHRGVQEVFIDPETNHLCVTYQDGYVQDLGDPLGDRVDQATSAGEYAAQVEQMIRSKESEINSKLASATVLSTDANEKYQQTIDIGTEVKTGKTYVDNKIATLFEDSVDGISKDDDTGKYYVDLTEYSTTTGVQTIVDTGIQNIDGIETYTSGSTVKYYLDPVKGNSRTTEAISNAIAEKLIQVDGIIYDASIGQFFVDLSDDAITSEEIHQLFV